MSALHRETSVSCGKSSPNSLYKTDAADAKTKAEEKIDQANAKEIVEELTCHLPQTDDGVTPTNNDKTAEMLRAVTKATEDMTPDEVASGKIKAHGKALSVAHMKYMGKESDKDTESDTAESSGYDLTPNETIQIDPMPEKPDKCHCGAKCVKNAKRRCNKGGPQQTYRCKSKGGRQHTTATTTATTHTIPVLGSLIFLVRC